MQQALGTYFAILLLIGSLYAGEKIAIHRRKIRAANLRALRKSAQRETERQKTKVARLLERDSCSCDQCNAEWPARRLA